MCIEIIREVTPLEIRTSITEGSRKMWSFGLPEPDEGLGVNLNAHRHTAGLWERAHGMEHQQDSFGLPIRSRLREW